MKKTTRPSQIMRYRPKQALELEGGRGKMTEKEGNSQKRLGGQRVSKLKSTLVRLDT